MILHIVSSILSHLPFWGLWGGGFVSDYDQKVKYTSSSVANLFNKLETEVVYFLSDINTNI